MADAVLFVGPSGCGIGPSLLRGIEVRAPARRGDIDHVVDTAARPGVIVLCDGAFKSAPAVSHAEICRALDRGWQVHGVSSIGAIRAHEMASEGMRGHGWVHAQFSRHDDFTDDEMCLLHLPVPPFEPLTEALVNVRYALETRGQALQIRAGARQAALAALGKLWFGDRTFERVREAMVRDAGIAPGTADRLMAWTRDHRIKTLDLAALLQLRPWEVRAAGAPAVSRATRAR